MNPSEYNNDNYSDLTPYDHFFMELLQKQNVCNTCNQCRYLGNSVQFIIGNYETLLKSCFENITL